MVKATTTKTSSAANGKTDKKKEDTSFDPIRKNIEDKIQKAQNKMKANREAKIAKNTELMQKMTKGEKKAILRAKKLERQPIYDKILTANYALEDFRKIKDKLKNAKRNKQDTSTYEKKGKDQLAKIMRLLDGKVYDACVRTDASRIIQTLLKYSGEEHGATIYKELKGKVLELATNVYGHNVVQKLFMYVRDPAVRTQMFDEIRGHVMTMLLKKFSAELLDHVYFHPSTTKSERIKILKEFYGNSYSYGLMTKSKNAESDEDMLSKKSLKEFLDENQGVRLKVIKNLAFTMKKVIEKKLFDLEIIQKLLVETFEVCDRSDVMDVVRDLVDSEALPLILHTKNGSQIASYCICYSDAKMRKQIIKSMKGLVIKAAKDSYGCVVVSKLLDSIDDTSLTGKNILKEMTAEMMDLLTNEFGSKTILNLLSPNNLKYFDPIRMKILAPTLREIGSAHIKEGTNIVTPTKKDAANIRRELLEQLGDKLIKTIIENTSTVLCDKHASNVVYEAVNPETIVLLKDVNYNFQKQIYEKAVQICLDKNQGTLEACSRVVCKMLIREEEQIKQKTDKGVLLAPIFHSKLKGTYKDFVLKGNGAFLVAALLSHSKTKADITSELKSITKQIVEKGAKDRGLKLLGVKLTNPK